MLAIHPGGGDGGCSGGPPGGGGNEHWGGRSMWDGMSPGGDDDDDDDDEDWGPDWPASGPNSSSTLALRHVRYIYTAYTKLQGSLGTHHSA